MEENEGRKVCPICGQPGSGPYPRWVRNSRKAKYEPYFYFKHVVKEGGKRRLKWCYVPREMIDDVTERIREYLASKGKLPR